MVISSSTADLRCATNTVPDESNRQVGRGEGAIATKEMGEFQMNAWVNAISEAIRAVKADDQSLKLQNEFYEKSLHPLETQA